MSERPPFPLLRSPGWPMLRERVEALGARDRRMRQAGELLLRPLRLLQSLGSDTPGALGRDVLAAERLRHLLYLASPWSSLVEEADKLLKASNGEDSHPAEPGIVDPPLLVIVGLAAIRVAPSPKLAHLFLRTVHGLALSATPAEMLGRLGAFGHQGSALGEVVNLMVLPDAIRLTENRLFLPRFALDPMERGRWLSLQRLFPEGLGRLIDDNWSEWALRTTTPEIDAVHPPDAAPGSVLTLFGSFSSLRPGAWPDGLRVLFFSPDAPPLEASVSAFDERSISLVVPKGSQPGWIGLADARTVERLNQARRRVRKRVAALFASSVAKGADGARLDRSVPVDQWLADVAPPAVPPRTAGNRYAGPREPSPERPPEAGRERTLVVFRPVVLEPKASRVGIEDVQHAARGILRAQGWQLVLRELPWVPDALAVLSSPVRSSDDPRVRTLLELTARTALVTPGLEDALFVVLVPGEPRVAAHAPAEGAAAVAVATLAGLPRVLQKTFPRREADEPRNATNRLRILARWLRSGGISLEATREEAARAAGPGAPNDTGLEAVAFDVSHREMSRSPITSFRKTCPARLGLLVPVSPEVTAVEIQSRGQTLQRIARIPEPPDLTDVRLQDLMLSWHHRHPRGARLRFSLEAGSDGVWTPFTCLCRGEGGARVPIQRLGSLAGLRLVATDGWNATVQELPDLIADGPGVVARRVSSGEWWADVPDSWQVRWRFEQRTSVRRVFQLDGRVCGLLRLVARDPQTGAVRSDERRIGGE